MLNVSLQKIKSVEITVKSFRLISTLEAISFLVLLFVAYVYRMPEMVRIVGMAHGVLFVLYVGGAIYMFKKLKWSIKDLFIVVMCSILPFGPFYVERKYL